MSIWQKAVRFVGFSGLGWILDFIVYSILGIWFSNLVLNNFISSWVGVTFVFIFATRKVFENSSKVPLHFTWELLLKTSKFIAKILITPITMTLNFFVMRGVVEKL